MTTDDTRSTDEIRQAVAERYGLPALLTDRLRGETAEDIEADARSLARKLPTPVEEDRPVFGGLDPLGSRPDQSDPRALARLAPRR